MTALPTRKNLLRSGQDRSESRGVEPAPIASNDARGRRTLRATGLLDSEPEREFDDIAELAVSLSGAEMAAITFVDEGRQWFKSGVGLVAPDTARAVALCGHAIHQPGQVLAIPETLEDERFRDSPLVVGEPGIRSYYGAPIAAPDGEVVGTLCVLSRAPLVLSRKQLEQIQVLARQVEQLVSLRLARDEALAAARARSDFLARTSHEIRTPLHGLIGTLELAMGEDDVAQVHEDLRTALSAGRQLSSLLSSVLDLSKADERGLELCPAETDLRDAIDQVVRIFEGTTRGKRVALRSRVDGDVPRLVSVDAVRLSQILGNLVGNAVKYTDSGAVEVLASRAGSDRTRFAVRDTGVGISKHVQARIFEAFEQGVAPGSGTGLGLALARELVLLMGGELTVSSTPGEGSTFAFEIDTPPVGGVDAPIEPASHAAPTGLRALIVDDNPVSLRVGSRVLAKLDLVVSSATSGTEALRRFDPDFTDIVLLDYTMPGMNGDEVCRRMRARGADDVVIIGFTATVEDAVTERCLAAGMDLVLPKPMRADELARNLAKLFADRAAQVA